MVCLQAAVEIADIYRGMAQCATGPRWRIESVERDERFEIAAFVASAVIVRT